MIGTNKGGSASFFMSEQNDSAKFSVATKSKDLLSVPAK